jgi:hypothetical protein
MPDRPWDQQLKDFLKRTGEDLKKTGDDIRAEAQKLLDEVRDPETQQKIRDGLGNLGQWAKKSAEEAANKIEEVVKRADDAWRGTTGSKPESGSSSSSRGTGKPRKTAKKAAKKSAKAKKKK